MPRVAQFLTPLKLEDEGGANWMVDAPLRFYSAELVRTLTVPAGTITDLASIPRVLWAIFPKSGPYNRAAVLHDGAYNHVLIDVNGYGLYLDKKTADSLFLEAMHVDGVSARRAKLMYNAVKLFGRPEKRPVTV